MSVLLIVLGSLLAYILVGVLLAKQALPAIVAAATHHKGDLYTRIVPGYSVITEEVRSKGDWIDRRVIRRKMWGFVFAWPVVAVNHQLDRALDRRDPQVHAKQAERIRELEVELGVDR